MSDGLGFISYRSPRTVVAESVSRKVLRNLGPEKSSVFEALLERRCLSFHQAFSHHLGFLPSTTGVSIFTWLSLRGSLGYGMCQHGY